MADQNISIKIGLDTTQFNNSIKGMTAELKALQKIDLTLLSPADSKAVIARMGDLKDSIKDVKKEIDNADPGQFFQSFSTLAGPAIAAISGIAVGMEMFGAKTEEVEKVQRKLMAVISLISTLQTIADANKLKSLIKQIPLQAMELKNRIANALLIKQEIVAETADLALKNAQQASIVKLTVLQKLWNKAVLSNPIMLLVAGIMALIGAIILLTKAFSKNNEEVKESEKSIDGLIIKNKELMKVHNEMVLEQKRYELELQKSMGRISQFEYDTKTIKMNTEDAVRVARDEMVAGIEQLKKTTQNKLKDVLSFNEQLKSSEDGNIMFSDWLIFDEDKMDKDMKKALDLVKIYQAKRDKEVLAGEDQYNKLLIDTVNKQVEDMRSMRESLVADEIGKLKIERKNKIDEYQKLYDEQYQQSTLYKQLIQATNNYYDELELQVIKKRNEEKLKLTTDNYEKLKQATLEAKQKLDEAQSPSDGLTKLEQQYIKDLEAQKEFHKKNLTSEEDFLRAKTELDQAYAMNQQIIILGIEKEKLDKLKEFRDKFLTQTYAEQRDAEISAMQELARESGASTLEIAQARAEIEKKYNAQISEYKNDIVDKDLNKQAEKEIAALNTSLIRQEDYEKQRQAILDKYKQMDDERYEQRMNQLNIANEAAMAAIQMISDQQQAANDAEMERMNQLYDDKKAKLDDQLEYGLISQAEYDAEAERMEKKKAEEERKMKIKQAKQEKLMAILSIALSTAMAIMKAYAQLGPIGGTAALPYLIASGVVQAAVVAAKPIPQFAAGGTMKSSGTALVGEMGPELVQLPAGAQVISNKDLRSSIVNNNSKLSNLTTNNNNGGVSYQQMMEFVDASFQKYSEIPVIVSEYEMTQKQTKVRNAQVNSQVQ